ncbi:MAG: heparinase II/III family protein [Bacillota bacterium]
MWARIQRGFRKPPKVIIQRLFNEIKERVEFFLAPHRFRVFKKKGLLRATGYPDIDSLWEALGEIPYLSRFEPINSACYHELCPGDRERIIEAAQAALEHRVNLLGSGWVNLGSSIDWSRDYKTGFRWRPEYFRKINYLNPDQPSDVKFPWELSRLQWLIPAGQAYRLTGDERYAVAVREILEDWMDQNPYATSVNWACTMEAALRIYTWSWFFHVFQKSQAWEELGFRLRFLSFLYLHGDFAARHLEFSDINGNHYIADAAGLVAAGLFFGNRREAGRWLRIGWGILTGEIKRQVYPDGVDFEMSVAYHRLVSEIFLLPAFYREACGLPVADDYWNYLIAMAGYTAAYSRNSGQGPLWGDADDGRVLPFGGQPINDHRYLFGLVGIYRGISDLIESFSGPRAEVFWLLGKEYAAKLPDLPSPGISFKSQAFPCAGFYIMRNDRDHIFIDCGPVGLAGRGGHGHNDCLAFEAVLDGTELVTDCGTYLYTASYKERNWFRSTACHNTPQIDDLELNRLISPDYLWGLYYDAKPSVKHWGDDLSKAFFMGSHKGYQRLKDPVIPERIIILEHRQHTLVVHDRFRGKGEHSIKIPLHLAPGVEAQPLEPGRVILKAGDRYFRLDWDNPGDWELHIEQARISPRYGVICPIIKLMWQRWGTIDKTLTLLLRSADIKNEVHFDQGWVSKLLNGID